MFHHVPLHILNLAFMYFDESASKSYETQTISLPTSAP